VSIVDCSYKPNRLGRLARSIPFYSTFFKIKGGKLPARAGKACYLLNIVVPVSYLYLSSLGSLGELVLDWKRRKPDTST